MQRKISANASGKVDFELLCNGVTKRRIGALLPNHPAQKAPINFKFMARSTLISNLESTAVKTRFGKDWRGSLWLRREMGRWGELAPSLFLPFT